jgi:hypothetical protein
VIAVKGKEVAQPEYPLRIGGSIVHQALQRNAMKKLTETGDGQVGAIRELVILDLNNDTGIVPFLRCCVFVSL